MSGDKTKLADRKITLETGEVSFWEAFDQLCLNAWLVEPAADAKEAVGRLHVMDGTQPSADRYAGALRIRVVPDSVNAQRRRRRIRAEMAIEPRFRQPKVLGAAKIRDGAGRAVARPLAALDKLNAAAAAMRVPRR